MVRNIQRIYCDDVIVVWWSLWSLIISLTDSPNLFCEKSLMYASIWEGCWWWIVSISNDLFFSCAALYGLWRAMPSLRLILRIETNMRTIGNLSCKGTMIILHAVLCSLWVCSIVLWIDLVLWQTDSVCANQSSIIDNLLPIVFVFVQRMYLLRSYCYRQAQSTHSEAKAIYIRTYAWWDRIWKA